MLEVLFLFRKLFQVTIILLASMSILVNGQTQPNLRLDQFSGINGVVLDPTHQLQNPNPWDINIVGVNGFLQNNYAYISKQSAIGLIKDTIYSANYDLGITGETEASVFDYYSKNKYRYHLDADILGPSFALHFPVKDKMLAVGFFSRIRAASGSNNIDGSLDYHNFEEQLYENLDDFQPMKTSFADWAEFGINAAYAIKDDTKNQWQIGVNLKYNLGYDGGFINSHSTISGYVDDIQAYLENYDVEAAYATAYDFDKDTYTQKSQGKGLGLDVGVTHVQNKYKRYGNEFEYLYDRKWNLSILDIGYIKFNGESHLFKGDPIDINYLTDFNNNENPNDFLQELSYKVYGDSTASYVQKDFVIGLPTTINFNYSQSISENQFLAAGVSQRFPVFKNAIKKANSAYISYNYQKEYMAFGGTFSMYEYTTPQLGGYVRIGPLFFGSDNLIPLFFKQDKLHSFSLFAGIKLYPFWATELKRHYRKECNCD